jgi:hypothetical protein
VEYTVDEVFGISRDLPLNYVERKGVDGKLKDELKANHHIVIYGSSKQGKTSLRKNCLSSDKYVLVQCSNRSDLADLHANILKRCGFELTQSQKKTTSGKNKVTASANFSIPSFIKLGGGGETEQGVTEEKIMAPLELDLEDVNDIIAALSEIKFNRIIVLEDFHYLPYETQRDFSVALKAFHEKSKYVFVIVGVWLEDNRLIVYNGDLTGRVISVNADRWSDQELRNVIDEGGRLLGISFDEEFKKTLVASCLESVYIVQEVCRRVCLQAAIHGTQSAWRIVGVGLDVASIIKDVVDEQTARYSAFLTNYSDGFQDTDLEMHKWLLYPILTSKISELEKGLRYRDVRASLQDVHPRKEGLNAGNITQSLKSAASLQSKKQIMPIIIDYDETAKKLNVVDKGFLLWLSHQDRDELLDDVGLPRIGN